MEEKRDTVKSPVEKAVSGAGSAQAAGGPQTEKADAGSKAELKPAKGQKLQKTRRPLMKKPAARTVRQRPPGKTDIGINVKPPERSCSDRNCPFHGRLPVRGQIFEGIVVSDGMDKSAVISRERLVYVPKYERYMKRTSRMPVHNPPCIAAKVGDEVTVMECRPLSKTISFTIVSKREGGQ